MRIVHITDPHFHEGPFRLSESKLLVLDQALSEPCDLVIIAGDLAHNARLGDEQMSTFHAVDKLSHVMHKDKPVILVEGNHDQFGTKGSALDLFHLPNLTKVANRLEYFGFEDTEIVCIPWIRRRDDWKQFVLNSLNRIEGTKKHRLLVGHMNIRDAVQNKNFRVNPDDHFVFSVEELKDTAFAPTSLVCGHLHERQVLAGINGCYGGAMTQSNFGEDGNPMGYVVWDDGVISFVDVVAPQFRNIAEEDFVPDDYNLYKFETRNPDLYSEFANVKCTAPKADVEVKVNTTAFNGRIELNQLIEEFCKESKLDIPQSPMVLEELKKISLSIARSQTGLDFVQKILLEKIGPSKDTIIIEKKLINFERGLNAIVGPNGRGKTLATEAIGASLYGKFVERGALKNFCHGQVDVWVAPNPNLLLSVRNKPSKKGGLDAWVGDTYCPKREDLATAIEPLFGAQNIFDAVVFMDQGESNDLVMAGEARALDVLAKMLNLTILEDYRKEYAKQAKDLKQLAQRVESYYEQLVRAREEQLCLSVDLEALTPPDTQQIKQLKEQVAYQAENEALQKKAKDWFEAMQAAEDNKVDPAVVEEIETRRQEHWSAKADLDRSKELFAKKQRAGCAPNYLPCFLLDALTEEDMKAKEARVRASEPRPEDQMILSRRDAQERAEKRATALYDERFNQTRVVYEDVEVLKLKIQLLEEQGRSWTSLRGQLDLKNAQVLRLEKQWEEAHEADQKYQDFAFLELLCSKKGLSLYVISSIVSGLQQKLDELTALADIGLQMRIQLSKSGDDSLDQFKVEYSRDGRPFANINPCASSGERMILRVLFKLGLMLYLNDYFGNYKVLIMDEPEKGLDSANVEVLLNMLRALKHRLNQIIVITHDPRIEQIADNVIRFE